MSILFGKITNFNTIFTVLYIFVLDIYKILFVFKMAQYRKHES